jgi:hypothetical protein
MRSTRALLLAGIATLAFPAASMAAADTQQVNGDVASELTITDLGAIDLPLTHGGPNTGSGIVRLTTTNPLGANVTATGTADGLLVPVAGAVPLSEKLSFRFGSDTAGFLDAAGVARNVSGAGVTDLPVTVQQTVLASEAIEFGDDYSMAITYTAVDNTEGV